MEKKTETTMMGDIRTTYGSIPSFLADQRPVYSLVLKKVSGLGFRAGSSLHCAAYGLPKSMWRLRGLPPSA